MTEGNTVMEHEYSENVSPVEPGDVVVIVDENYQRHLALVTCVHGQFGATYDTPDGGTRHYVPCINVVYTSTDPAKRDPYGAQIERMSSLQHLSQGPANMPRPGRFWANPA